MKILKAQKLNQDLSITIITFYYFATIKEGIHLFRDKLEDFCRKHNIFGTVLIAEEGVNGTLSIANEDVEKLYSFFEVYEEFKDITFKESYYKTHAFGKLKIRIKKEVVSSGEARCEYNPGFYVEPKDWDTFISRPDVINIDTRNDFEYIIGTFKGSINPKTDTFREFKEWCEINLKDKNQIIAGFCTGGVRCEKSTSWLKKAGYKNVYHLKGGIIGYFIETGNENGMWRGDCFVFDDRVVINDKLESC
jgi:UPF0176 protein